MGIVLLGWSSLMGRSRGSLTDLGMAVVVQQQIASDKSGVLFTTDPIRQRSDQMVIEAGMDPERPWSPV